MNNRTFLLSMLFLVLTTVSFGQKTKSKKIEHTYKMYPWLKYDASIDKYQVQVNYQHAFLAGKLNLNADTTTKTTTFSFIDKKPVSSVWVDGLTFTPNEGLKIVIDYRSIGDADAVVKNFDDKTKEMINADNVLALVGKMKAPLVFADVKIMNGAEVLENKSFKWKSEYKTEYIDYYKNKTGKKYEGYQMKIAFTDKKANALYFIGNDIGFTASQIGRYVNGRIGFVDKKTELVFATAKGKKMDYSEMNDAQAKALAAVPSVNKTDLKACVDTWLALAKKADFANKKAQYNAAVVGALYANSLSACLVMEDFELFETVNTQITANRANLKKSNLKNYVRITKQIDVLKKNREINAHRL